MQRLASEFFGKRVVLRQESMVVGEVKEIIINPENGVFLGFMVVVPNKKRIRFALPEKEIMGIGREFILVKSMDSLGDPEEIVRIKRARETKISIIRNRVYTVNNVYLGRVYDYSIDLVTGKLSRLYVQSLSLKLTRGHLIDARRVVSIKKHRITVDDATIKTKKKPAVKRMAVKTECN